MELWFKFVDWFDRSTCPHQFMRIGFWVYQSTDKNGRVTCKCKECGKIKKFRKL